MLDRGQHPNTNHGTFRIQRIDLTPFFHTAAKRWNTKPGKPVILAKVDSKLWIFQNKTHSVPPVHLFEVFLQANLRQQKGRKKTPTHGTRTPTLGLGKMAPKTKQPRWHLVSGHNFFDHMKKTWIIWPFQIKFGYTQTRRSWCRFSFTLLWNPPKYVTTLVTTLVPLNIIKYQTPFEFCLGVDTFIYFIPQTPAWSSCGRMGSWLFRWKIAAASVKRSICRFSTLVEKGFTSGSKFQIYFGYVFSQEYVEHKTPEKMKKYLKSIMIHQPFLSAWHFRIFS